MKCKDKDCKNEAAENSLLCKPHTELFDNQCEIGNLKETIRKQNLLIKHLQEDVAERQIYFSKSQQLINQQKQKISKLENK